MVDFANAKQDLLDNFKDQNEFSYVSKDDESERGKNKRKDDKWWIPTPKVPPNGLSEVTRKWLQFQKDSVHQVLKAAMAINAQVVSEMEIPENYIDSLPKVKSKTDFHLMARVCKTSRNQLSRHQISTKSTLDCLFVTLTVLFCFLMAEREG